MPIIQVGGDIALAYDDSGAPLPSSKPYVTIVLVHGTIFYNRIFTRLFPYATKSNLRLLAVNMRDYPDSSPNTPEELEDLGSGDPQRQAKYFKSAALQIAMFASKAVIQLGLPEPTADKKAGGITILGWSSGTLYMTALLAHARNLPKEDKAVLSNYLRTVVLFDPAWFPTGHQLPPAVLAAPNTSPLYSPMRDMTLTDAERIAKFFSWFSAYFEPPITMLFPLRTEHDLQKAIAMQEARVETGVPTLKNMSQADRDFVSDLSQRVRTSNQMIRFTKPSVYKDNYLNAFVVSDDDDAVWPGVDVLIMWGEQSVFETSWTAATIQDWLENGSNSLQEFGPGPKEMAGKRPRKIRYASIAGGNHFMPWDEPEKVVQCFSEYV